MLDRRKFFQGLIAGGASVRKNRKRVAHRQDVVLYRGPMEIPAHVYEAVREDPTPHRATGRGTHLVSRYVEPDGTVWLFRCQIPAHRGMVGEIVQGRPSDARRRVHCWQAADPGSYRTPEQLLANHIQKRPASPIMPPLIAPSQPGWMIEQPDYSEYVDQKFLETP